MECLEKVRLLRLIGDAGFLGVGGGVISVLALVTGGVTSRDGWTG